MKAISILCLVLAVFLVVSNYALAYWLGYSEAIWAFHASDPILALIAEFMLFLILCAAFVTTIIQKNGRLWLLVTLVGFWPLVILTFLLAQNIFGTGGSLILHGLHDRVMHDYSLDDLRNFAKDYSSEIHSEVDHGDLTGLSDSEKLAFAKFKEKYPFMRWMDDGRFFKGPSIFPYPQSCLTVEWGGPLAGHRGFCITIDGQKNDPAEGFMTIRASNDLYFYMSD